MANTRLKRRSDGRFAVKIRYTDANGKTHQFFVYDEDEQTCKDKAAEARERLRTGQPIKDSRGKLSDFAQEWLDTTLKLNKKLKETTKDWYTNQARKRIIDDPIGNVRLDQLRVSDIEKWILAMQDTDLSESTIRGAYTTLHKILDSAMKKQLIRTNWAALVERPTVTKHEAVYLDEKQVIALLKASEESRYGLLIRLLAFTGLRRGEALSLKWKDNIRPNGTNKIHVTHTLARLHGKLTPTTPKTHNADRWLVISEPVAAVLKALKVRQAGERLKAGTAWEDTGYVFTTETGQPCDPRNALRALYTAAQAAGLSGIGLHTLRHSAATLMLDAGVPLLTVSRQLGHYSVSVTGDLYGHVGDSASEQAMNALAEAIG